MEKCKCWEEKRKIIGWDGADNPIYSKLNIQICNGTKEREECSCNGNSEKCTFYPEKRKETKTMNTAEMYLQAKEDGKFYKTCSNLNSQVFYQKNIGIFDENNDSVPIHLWNYFDDMMEETWELCDNMMTRVEAEQKFNIKIID